MSKSCVGCKYLLREDGGYRNYTVEDTSISCLLGKNPNLPAREPWDWNEGIAGNHCEDNWPLTAQSRCKSYSLGDAPHIDVEREEQDSSKSWQEECMKYSDDPEVKEALRKFYS